MGKRLAAIKDACTNEESTKLQLILPMLTALGYDTSNPYEVYPEHAASFVSSVNNRVDFAVLRDGAPIIAIECKKGWRRLGLRARSASQLFQRSAAR